MRGTMSLHVRSLAGHAWSEGSELGACGGEPSAGNEEANQGCEILLKKQMRPFPFNRNVRNMGSRRPGLPLQELLEGSQLIPLMCLARPQPGDPPLQFSAPKARESEPRDTISSHSTVVGPVPTQRPRRPPMGLPLPVPEWPLFSRCPQELLLSCPNPGVPLLCLLPLSLSLETWAACPLCLCWTFRPLLAVPQSQVLVLLC